MPDLSAIPVFVLVFFRTAGLMLGAPLFGSANIPRRVKVLLAVVLAWGLSLNVARPALPATAWGLAIGIGGELLFGIAMGLALGFVFVAVSWSGEIIGQQMGINLAETFDPSFGKNASLVGDLYFMLALVVFLICGGHRQMVVGIRFSFDALPLLSVGMNRPVFDLLVNLLTAATVLAMQMAAPTL